PPTPALCPYPTLFRSPASDRVLAERPPPAVEVLEGPAHREIARRTDVAAPEAAGEEPVGGPPAEPPLLGEPLDHRLARRRRQRVDRKSTRLNSSHQII